MCETTSNGPSAKAQGQGGPHTAVSLGACGGALIFFFKKARAWPRKSGLLATARQPRLARAHPLGAPKNIRALRIFGRLTIRHRWLEEDVGWRLGEAKWSSK